MGNFPQPERHFLEIFGSNRLFPCGTIFSVGSLSDVLENPAAWSQQFDDRTLYLMDEELFRPEAVNFQRQRLIGPPIEFRPLPFVAIGVPLFLTTLSLLAFASLTFVTTTRGIVTEIDENARILEVEISGISQQALVDSVGLLLDQTEGKELQGSVIQTVPAQTCQHYQECAVVQVALQRSDVVSIATIDVGKEASLKIRNKVQLFR